MQETEIIRQHKEADALKSEYQRLKDELKSKQALVDKLVISSEAATRTTTTQNKAPENENTTTMNQATELLQKKLLSVFKALGLSTHYEKLALLLSGQNETYRVQQQEWQSTYEQMLKIASDKQAATDWFQDRKKNTQILTKRINQMITRYTSAQQKQRTNIDTQPLRIEYITAAPNEAEQSDRLILGPDLFIKEQENNNHKDIQQEPHTSEQANINNQTRQPQDHELIAARKGLTDDRDVQLAKQLVLDSLDKRSESQPTSTSSPERYKTEQETNQSLSQETAPPEEAAVEDDEEAQLSSPPLLPLSPITEQKETLRSDSQPTAVSLPLTSPSKYKAIKKILKTAKKKKKTTLSELSHYAFVDTLASKCYAYFMEFHMDARIVLPTSNETESSAIANGYFVIMGMISKQKKNDGEQKGKSDNFWHKLKTSTSFHCIEGVEMRYPFDMCSLIVILHQFCRLYSKAFSKESSEGPRIEEPSKPSLERIAKDALIYEMAASQSVEWSVESKRNDDGKIILPHAVILWMNKVIEPFCKAKGYSYQDGSLCVASELHALLDRISDEVMVYNSIREDKKALIYNLLHFYTRYVYCVHLDKSSWKVTCLFIMYCPLAFVDHLTGLCYRLVEFADTFKQVTDSNLKATEQIALFYMAYFEFVLTLADRERHAKSSIFTLDSNALYKDEEEFIEWILNTSHNNTRRGSYLTNEEEEEPHKDKFKKSKSLNKAFETAKQKAQKHHVDLAVSLRMKRINFEQNNTVKTGAIYKGSLCEYIKSYLHLVPIQVASYKPPPLPSVSSRPASADSLNLLKK